jgi:hypothetical protein
MLHKNLPKRQRVFLLCQTSSEAHGITRNTGYAPLFTKKSKRFGISSVKQA